MMKNHAGKLLYMSHVAVHKLYEGVLQTTK